MKRTNDEGGSYILTADAGRDLALKDENSNIVARTKEMQIPAVGTLNTWVEVVEEPPVVVDEDKIKETRIAELKAELARLEIK